MGKLRHEEENRLAQVNNSAAESGTRFPASQPSGPSTAPCWSQVGEHRQRLAISFFANSFNTTPSTLPGGDSYHRLDMRSGGGANLSDGTWPRTLTTTASLPVPSLPMCSSLLVTTVSLALWMLHLHLLALSGLLQSFALLFSHVLLFSASLFFSLFFLSFLCL